MTDWQKRTRQINVGDTVGFSKAFLQSTGQYTGDVPFARGRVKSLRTYGDTTIAEVEWDTPDMAKLVNVVNLTTTRGIQLGE